MSQDESSPRPGIRHRVYWGLFLASMLAMGWQIRWHVMGLDAEVRREGLSNVAVVACRNVLVDHLDIETGLRGYLITGRREFLRPYHQGLGRADRDMATLETAVTALPDEAPHFEVVSTMSRDMLAEFSNQVTAADEEGLYAGQERFRQFPTKPAMDRLRSSLLAIQVEEDRRLAANMASLVRSMARTIFLINGFLIVLTVLLAAMATGFVSPPLSGPFRRGR